MKSVWTEFSRTTAHIFWSATLVKLRLLALDRSQVPHSENHGGFVLLAITHVAGRKNLDRVRIGIEIGMERKQ
jgi:hypothetical protein